MSLLYFIVSPLVVDETFAGIEPGETESRVAVKTLKPQAGKAQLQVWGEIILLLKKHCKLTIFKLAKSRLRSDALLKVKGAQVWDFR